MSRPSDVWRLLNYTCREFTRLASESLDRDLNLPERGALRSHLLFCRGCRRYSRQIALIRAAFRKLAGDPDSGEVPPGPALPEPVRERIRQALKDR